jgi:hypothetical protein
MQPRMTCYTVAIHLDGTAQDTRCKAYITILPGESVPLYLLYLFLSFLFLVPCRYTLRTMCNFKCGDGNCVLV